MSDYVPAIKVADCPPNQGIEVVVAGRMVAIFNVDGDFFALDGVCPHQGGPLGKGQICEHIVTCPWHGWQFDVRNGHNQITPTIVQPRLPIKVDGEDVLVCVSE
jgi:nitrite reductase/ring-hydroxylating ferredoxin subunit